MAGLVWHSKLEDYRPQEMIRIEKGTELLIRATAGCPSPVEVLDIGCGSGPLHGKLAKERFRITGLELEEESAAAARQNYAQVECQDLVSPWPFEDGSFDAVFAAAVLEHVVDYDAVMAHAARVLRPGGCLLVEVPNLGYWKEVRKLIFRRQPHWLKNHDHVHGWTLGYLKEKLARHGFRAVRAECDRLNLPLVPPCRVLERWLASWGRVLIVQLVKTSEGR